jgi:hypothetical protein
VHADDAVNVGVSQIGQCDVVAMQEGQTGIVILKVKRLTKSLGILIDEAKYASVLAGVLFIHKRSFKIQTNIIIFAFFYAYPIFLAIAKKSQGHFPLSKIKAVVENVVYFIVIYMSKHVARYDAALACA